MSSPASASRAPSPAPRWPPQVRYIVGQEACERFSFYGMRNILTVFLVGYLLQALPEAERPARAKEIFHLFVMAVYLTPLLGGWLADRFFGKYRTILWLSLVYCAGHGCLALFDRQRGGFFLGLGLIALGSGGIKPCVSAFVGDQFTAENRSLMSKVYAAFYWSINLGSLLASLIIPKLLRLYGPRVAFGIPGVLMLVATVIFVLGRRHYRELPPSGGNPHGFLRVLATALRPPPLPAGAGTPLPAPGAWLDRALVAHPPQAVDGARAVLRVLRIFAFVPFFWMLFDQKASAWVLQARAMDLTVGPFQFEPAQLQFINPALVMILIPLSTSVLYPALTRAGFPFPPVRRMTVGMFLAALSFVMVAAIEARLQAGARPSVLWQIAPYVALTLGEVLVSVSGLELAYTEAPAELKSTIQSFWHLTVFAGNLIVAVVTRLNVFTGVASFLFYAGLITVAGIGLAVVARLSGSRRSYSPTGS